MGEEVKIPCPSCGAHFWLSEIQLGNLLRLAKIGKVGKVAHQLSVKQGPYYDRWRAAMDARGEQKRCKDCERYGPKRVEPKYQWCAHTGQHVNPGRFACRMFIKLARG